jgi:hypothetical protein
MMRATGTATLSIRPWQDPSVAVHGQGGSTVGVAVATGLIVQMIILP